MAHQEQIDFCTKIKNQYPEHFKNKWVLDAGSYDVNGNNRYLFENCVYLGADIAHGNNVDIVSKIHDLNFKNEMFDTIITTEMLEHDVFYYLSLNNLIRMLKPNGLFLFTCATDGRGEHGTLRCDTYASPHTTNVPLWANYYKNLNVGHIRECLDLNAIFEPYRFEVNTYSHDLYFYGIKH